MKNGVFIIESNTLENEEEETFEGNILKNVLELTGIEVKYFYIRTKLELKVIVKEFRKSNYKYLHLACHADEKGIDLTLERVNLRELKNTLGENFEKKRLFLSACSIGNGRIGKVFEGTGFRSISAFDDEVYFDSAAIFWSTFYHLLSKKKRKNDSSIQKIFEDISEMFDCYPVHYVLNSEDESYDSD